MLQPEQIQKFELLHQMENFKSIEPKPFEEGYRGGMDLNDTTGQTKTSGGIDWLWVGLGVFVLLMLLAAE